ncbi:hypothetical protein [Pararhizobium sp. A13]|uniref:hypothetical protein n=1 Tax=Pararhizobium sp. A13 TaxID=3133975 RepID=UPI0032566EB5
MGAELLSDDVESAFDIIEGALPHDWLGVGIYVPYPTTPTGRRYLLNPCDNPEQMAVANLRLVLVGTFLNHEAIVPQSTCGTVTHFSLRSEYRLSIETLADHGNVSPALDRADQLKRQLKRMCRDRLAPPLFPRFGAVAWMRFKHVRGFVRSGLGSILRADPAGHQRVRGPEGVSTREVNAVCPSIPDRWRRFFGSVIH